MTFSEKYGDILDRYHDRIMQEMVDSGFYAVLEIKPQPGNETSDIHLLWMIQEIHTNKSQSYTKKHRWLGCLQGIMIAKGYTTVTEERDFTRSYFDGE